MTRKDFRKIYCFLIISWFLGIPQWVWEKLENYKVNSMEYAIIAILLSIGIVLTLDKEEKNVKEDIKGIGNC